MRRARQAHEQAPRSPEDVSTQALRLARLALVIAGVVALVCIGADAREVIGAASALAFAP